jgi:PAN domain
MLRNAPDLTENIAVSIVRFPELGCPQKNRGLDPSHLWCFVVCLFVDNFLVLGFASSFRVRGQSIYTRNSSQSTTTNTHTHTHIHTHIHTASYSTQQEQRASTHTATHTHSATQCHTLLPTIMWSKKTGVYNICIVTTFSLLLLLVCYTHNSSEAVAITTATTAKVALPLTSFVETSEYVSTCMLGPNRVKTSSVDVTSVTGDLPDPTRDAHMKDDAAIDLTKLPEGAPIDDGVAAVSPAGDGVGSCCGNKRCAYANGVCCPGSTHCCPADMLCATSGDAAAPTCVSTNSSEPVKGPLRILKIDVHKRVDENEEKRKQEERLKRSEEQTKKSTIEQEQKAKRQAPPDADRSILDSIPPTPDATELPSPPTEQKTPPVKKIAFSNIGAPWPPMEEFAKNEYDRQGLWIERKGTDWAGFGLVKNGTTNRVTDKKTCESQCQAITECRLFLYIENTRECWLDSEPSIVGRQCPVRDGQTKCTSVFKKVRQQDQFYSYGKTANDERSWVTKRQENWHGPGGLVRNGKRNVAIDEVHCRGECANMKYCRIAIYYPSTKECWLATSVASQPSQCALRRGSRNCVSFVKRKTPVDAELLMKKFVQATNDDRGAQIQDPLSVEDRRALSAGDRSQENGQVAVAKYKEPKRKPQSRFDRGTVISKLEGKLMKQRNALRVAVEQVQFFKDAEAKRQKKQEKEKKQKKRKLRPNGKF